LRAGAYVDACDGDGRTPLMLLCDFNAATATTTTMTTTTTTTTATATAMTTTMMSTAPTSVKPAVRGIKTSLAEVAAAARRATVITQRR
jgi:hypothetical protein